MLIIAIPKSASTSLMLTLGKYQNLEAKQDFSFSKNKIAHNCQILHQIHSDVRELKLHDVERLCTPGRIFKQHIYPTENNVLLLSKRKKVILLRSPDEIILAYRRGVINKTHRLFPGYSIEMSDDEWLKKSKSNGLYADLSFFYQGWKERAKSETTLFVDYQDYVQNPDFVLHKIERFYELPITEQKVKTIKARYTRRSSLGFFAFRVKNKAQKTLRWMLSLKRT